MKTQTVLAILCVLLMVSCQGDGNGTGESRPEKVEYLGSDPGKPFCEAVRVGRWLILSGKIGIDPETGELAPGGIQAETRQVMENIEVTLGKYGSSLDRVVKCTVMLADISEWPAMNEIYVQYFPTHRPARSAFAASGLAMNARVEIECWAVVD